MTRLNAKQQAWSTAATDIGGELVIGGLLKLDQVRYRHRNWQIVFDSYTGPSSQGGRGIAYTRVRSAFVHKGNFLFKIVPEDSLHKMMAKMFKMQDVEIGDPEFDKAFVIKSNNPARMAEFLDHATLKALIPRDPETCFEIKEGKERLFGVAVKRTYPDGVNAMHLQKIGVETDVDEIKKLIGLFTLTLDRLVEQGLADDRDPGADVP